MGTEAVNRWGCLSERRILVMGIRWKKASWLSSAMVVALLLSLGLACLQPAGPAVAEDATSTQAGQEGCCCSRPHGECCAVTARNCACGEEAAMRNRIPRLHQLAFGVAAEEQEQPAPQKNNATREARMLGGEIRKALLNHQRALKEGYVCCTMPGCVFCQTVGDSCPCGTNLRKGEPVCPECWGGWQAGQGAIPATRREDVKIFPQETLKAMYEMRAKTFQQALESKSVEKKNSRP
jgi:hypothetical protein